MLAGHEQSNHHVGNLMVGNRLAVLVRRGHEMLHHVVLAIIRSLSAAVLDNVHVDLSNSSLSVITLAVRREREPVKHEVVGCEAHVQVVV